MRKFLMLFLIVFFLSACSDDSKIKDAVRQNLKDPDSAIFKDTVFSTDNKRACIEYNAKNSMGGYGDWNYAELQKENSDWVVRAMSVSAEKCLDIGFKVRPYTP